MCVPIESYRVAGGPSPPLSDYNSRGASGTRIALQRPCHGAASVGKVAAMFFYGHRDVEVLVRSGTHSDCRSCPASSL